MSVEQLLLGLFNSIGAITVAVVGLCATVFTLLLAFSKPLPEEQLDIPKFGWPKVTLLDVVGAIAGALFWIIVGVANLGILQLAKTDFWNGLPFGTLMFASPIAAVGCLVGRPKHGIAIGIPVGLLLWFGILLLTPIA